MKTERRHGVASTTNLYEQILALWEQLPQNERETLIRKLLPTTTFGQTVEVKSGGVIKAEMVDHLAERVVKLAKRTLPHDPDFEQKAREGLKELDDLSPQVIEEFLDAYPWWFADEEDKTAVVRFVNAAKQKGIS
ncbi:MAG: hypothetical protein HY459_03710 [Parcubacteria group bacterium]|nr:hypothetical protein [Parcubacteria group bacterium]